MMVGDIPTEWSCSGWYVL